MMDRQDERELGDRVVELTRREFPASELGTALWLLRECATDEERKTILPKIRRRFAMPAGA